VIAGTRRAPRNLRQFFALFGVSVVLLLARDSDPVRGAQSVAAQIVMPLQRAITDAGGAASHFLGAIGEIDRLRGENAQLRARVDGLALENVDLRERAVAAEQTAKLQQVQSALAHEAVAARVIARDPTGLVHALTLDAGTDQGVAIGHVVVADQGLVGRVTEVGPSYSKVVPITDSSSSIIALVQRSRATGIVRGMFGDALLLEWILQSEEVAPGDVLITAGLALSQEVRSLYPKGLVIGTVLDVQKADVLAYQKAVVRPAVDQRRLERVLILKVN
jgi:rod shape-determining protein MreC